MGTAPAQRSGHDRALDVLRPVPNDRLEIRDDPAKGRGVFARPAIAAGALIEAAPVILVPSPECTLLDRTILHDYYFRWDANSDGTGSDGTGSDGTGDTGRGAVALGLVALCNHSRRPRARVRRNHRQNTLDLVALAPIATGEEVTIDYHCPLWFEAQD